MMVNARELDLLLVEDNANDAELALRAIKRALPGLKGLHLDDGVEALDYLCGRGAYAHRNVRALPRLILLDLKLPRIDGLEVLRQIRSSVGLREIPVVIYSSSREQRDLAEAYACGVNSYVVKPVPFEAFLQAMAQVATYWLAVNELPDNA